MSNNKLISIIMPAYNAANYIRQAIDSILNQTYKNFELLVADDASTDNTKELIDQYQDPRIIRNHNMENLGYLRTCNKLFKLCKGDFITFQDADDWSENKRLELQMEAFDKDPGLYICGTQWIKTDVQGTPVSYSNFPLEYANIIKAIPNEFPFFPNSALIKREVYEDIGGYHEFFDRIGAEDWYWLSIIVDKYKMINLSDYLCYYRTTPGSITQTVEDIRKIYVADLVKDLVKVRRRTGTDPLITNDIYRLKRMERKYSGDKYLIQKKQMYDQLHRKEYHEGFKMVASIIKANPFQGFAFYRNTLYFMKKLLFDRILLLARWEKTQS